MAQAKQEWGNPLQEAIGKLTGLGADKLPATVATNWQEEFLGASAAAGQPLAIIVGVQPKDQPFVAVWPGNNGLTAEHSAKSEKVKYRQPYAVFIVSAKTEG